MLKHLIFLGIEYRMDMFTRLFWFFSIVFFVLSVYLLCFTKKTSVFYAQIASGCGMFITSKIGRTFLGLD
jgi:hypothetical protein